MFKYSIIIPHKNSPTLLERCVLSIPQRNDIEIIIVDDNSDDDLKPKINRQNTQIIFLSKDLSKGAGRARNIGMSKAKGKWLLFADADDFYEKEFIHILDEYVDSDLDVVYFNCRSVDTENLLPNNIAKPIHDLNLMCDGKKNMEDCLRFKVQVPWIKMLNHSYVKRHGFLFEEINNGNDIQFAYLTSYFAKKYIIDHRTVYIYTYNKNSITFKKRSIQFYKCSLENYYKKLGFRKFIGHPEWNTSIFKIFISSFKKGGVLVFCNLISYYFSHLCYLLSQKYKYVTIINYIKNKSYVF